MNEEFFKDILGEATWYLTPGNNGPANGNWGGCAGNGWNALFSPSDVDTITKCELMWPPPGYSEKKGGGENIEHIRTIPAGIINRGGDGVKDTLTMTEIEFNIYKRWFHWLTESFSIKSKGYIYA